MRQMIFILFIISLFGCSFKTAQRKMAKEEMNQLFLGNRIAKVHSKHFYNRHIVYLNDTLTLKRYNFIAFKDTLLKEYYFFTRAEYNMTARIKTDSSFKVLDYSVYLPPVY